MPETLERTASCTCNALSVVVEGEPIKVSACHCLACQRRTGSAFSVAVFFPRAAARQAGPSHTFIRIGDSGQPVEFHFCSGCGSSVFWYPAFRPAWIAVAHGCFHDRALTGPTQAVYEDFKLGWVSITTGVGQE